MVNNKVLGNLGEEYACELLRKKGHKIIQRNVFIGKGEIDIIAKYKGILVFVEVKTRTDETYVDILDSIDKAKCERLSGICEEYLAMNKLDKVEWRIDLIGIVLKNRKIERFEHFEGIV